jgi:hypothetical protein
MIHLLIVGDTEGSAVPPPDFEVLHARDADEAAEKLARNRRIDALLFFDETLEREVAALLRGEDPALPPAFVAGDGEDPFAAVREALGG